MGFKIGKWLELEATFGALFVRVGVWERYWNTRGLPSS